MLNEDPLLWWSVRKGDVIMTHTDLRLFNNTILAVLLNVSTGSVERLHISTATPYYLTNNVTYEPHLRYKTVEET